MHKLQHCLGVRGKGGKIKADRVNCPKNFVLHCRLLQHTESICTRNGGVVQEGARKWLLTYFQFDVEVERFKILQTKSKTIFRFSKSFKDSHTVSPSSKYEHRRASALLRNIRNIRICMVKKRIVSVTYGNERISIKHSLPYVNVCYVSYVWSTGRFMAVLAELSCARSALHDG